MLENVRNSKINGSKFLPSHRDQALCNFVSPVRIFNSIVLYS